MGTSYLLLSRRIAVNPARDNFGQRLELSRCRFADQSESADLGCRGRQMFSCSIAVLIVNRHLLLHLHFKTSSLDVFVLADATGSGTVSSGNHMKTGFSSSYALRRKGGRIIPSLPERRWLVELLNDALSPLAGICEDLRQLEKLGRSLSNLYAKPRVRFVIKKLQWDSPEVILPRTALAETYQRFQKLEASINARLSRYSSSPKVFFDIRSKTWATTESWQEENPKEFLAVQRLRALLREGKLRMIRRCKRKDCLIWFQARRGQSAYCPGCERNRMTMRAEYKKGRAEYMRRYRTK